ncbi:GTPase IMAP family member 8-like [Centroberyx affinis]|uniref:GTPase IMAP family member 8-like n=1 Tax=Centroberyx affinis TaxID=166261 RepID=UPI003A5C0A3A
MSHNGMTDMKQTMMVVSMEEEWSSFKSLLQDSFGDKSHQLSFRSLGPNQVCDVTMDGRLVTLHYAVLKQDMTEEGTSQAVDSCFKSCAHGIRTFLLLIQGGRYTKKERRMIEMLQAYFGVEALKYLSVLSLEGGTVVDVLDDSLLELINVCDGRYCRITGSPATSDELGALLEMVDYMLTENGAAGYTESMLSEAKRRTTEDTAMKMLRQKVQEAEEKEQAFNQLVQQQEESRAREAEELKSKHAEERRKEAAEKRQYETKRESLDEAVRSHRAMLQLQTSTANDEDVRKTSVILLGLSGSGKSSAGNLILERAGNQYSVNENCRDSPEPTLACERKEVLAEGSRLILVDTPELWDEDGTENLELVKDCLALSLPGPHVFMLVLQVGRFTQGESEMLGHLQKIFGREFVEHTVVLFTRCDDNLHRAQRITDYVAGAHASLQDLIRKCGSRYYVLNVRNSQNALSYPQVKDLLSGINKLVASHGGGCYSTRRFSMEELKERKKVIEERN